MLSTKYLAISFPSPPHPPKCVRDAHSRSERELFGKAHKAKLSQVKPHKTTQLKVAEKNKSVNLFVDQPENEMHEYEISAVKLKQHKRIYWRLLLFSASSSSFLFVSLDFSLHSLPLTAVVSLFYFGSRRTSMKCFYGLCIKSP